MKITCLLNPSMLVTVGCSKIKSLKVIAPCTFSHALHGDEPQNPNFRVLYESLTTNTMTL